MKNQNLVVHNQETNSSNLKFVSINKERSSKSIKDWHPDDRPRERLLKLGAENLSDSELLAILIGSGSGKFSAIDTARLILEKSGSISNLASNLGILRSQKGIGDAKYCKIASSLELAKRIKFDYSDLEKIDSVPSLAKRFVHRFYNAKQEFFYVVLFNTNLKVLAEIEVSKGILDSSLVHAREVFKPAISHSAKSIALVHNHPSGNPKPSQSDIQLTNQLIEASNIIGIKIVDHLIIAGDEYFSMMSEGYF